MATKGSPGLRPVPWLARVLSFAFLAPTVLWVGMNIPAMGLRAIPLLWQDLRLGQISLEKISLLPVGEIPADVCGYPHQQIGPAVARNPA